MRVAADIVVVLHCLFVLFVVAGALLAWRWPRLIWLHLPAVAWAAWIEFAGWVCPLTPLENRLRLLAGGSEYRGGFVEHYVLPALYPHGLTRSRQVIFGLLVLSLNLAVYAWLLTRGKIGKRQKGVKS